MYISDHSDRNGSYAYFYDPLERGSCNIRFPCQIELRHTNIFETTNTRIIICSFEFVQRLTRKSSLK